jgi:hypothetical protein
MVPSAPFLSHAPAALSGVAVLADGAVPTGTRTTLVAVMVTGVLMLLYGARLLRPAVVVFTMLVGFLGAVAVARELAPGVPLWGAAAVGAVAGLLAGALLYRPTVALSAAAVGATVGALVGFAVMAGGSLDTAPRDLGHALVASPREAARPGDGERAGRRMLSVLAAPDGAEPAAGVDAHLAAAATQALPAGDRLLRHAAAVVRDGSHRLLSAYRDTAPAYRTLLLGCTGTGAILGLGLGLIATGIVARILTSCAGAWMLVAGTLPLLAMHGHAPLPDDARAWLVTVAGLAVVGTLAQSWTAPSGPAKASTRATPARRTSAPEPARTAAA